MLICFSDFCNNCQHQIGKHNYHFTIEGDFQVGFIVNIFSLKLLVIKSNCYVY